MMKKKMTYLILAVIVAGVGVILTLRSNAKKGKAELREETATMGAIKVTVLATGIAQPQNRVEIKPPIAGRADEILVKEGDKVVKGQILARMSSLERAALLDAARAKGPEELEHWESLYKPTPLVAPLNGIIIARSIEPGQTVTSQEAVLVMSDRLIVKAQVDETDIGSIHVGQEATLSLDAYASHILPAKVGHVAYEAKTVSNVTIYEVDVVPGSVPDFMRSGMTANVEFLVARKNDILTLPAEAVLYKDGRTLVMRPKTNGNGRNKGFDLTEIAIGITDGKTIEVLSGLAAADTVLVKRLESGQRRQQASSPFMPSMGRGRGANNAPRTGGSATRQ
ncbi:MAG: HlyD family efflux transporter periplasmic adaptor subunit [Elusimicrobiota bacterium]